jgi:hypothetical protein
MEQQGFKPPWVLLKTTRTDLCRFLKNVDFDWFLSVFDENRWTL